jgi:hypothetical protein
MYIMSVWWGEGEGPSGWGKGGGVEAARLSLPPLWCERHALAGRGGGVFPIVTSILRHECRNQFRPRVKIHEINF